jgi:hypothetical protein
MRAITGGDKMIEGYLQKQANGRYAINGIEFTSGETIEVRVNRQWLEMRFECDGEYYLMVQGFSFYPRGVYARYQ